MQAQAIELSVAVATGVALGAGSDPSLGAGVGAALCVIAMPEKQNLTVRQWALLALGAVTACVVVSASAAIIAHWSDFTKGFAQAYAGK